MISLRSKHVHIRHETHPENIAEFLIMSRYLNREDFVQEKVNDPFLMPDMELAVERIIAAQKKWEKVMIFWDYDVDGISSTAALFLFLKEELWILASYRLPHRVHDGYGIKQYHIDEIVKTGSTLLITVDCGSRDREAVEYAHELWLDVIITDHHSCPQDLPECIAFVNPKRSDSLYPFLGLSGSWVVWKLIHAVSKSVFNEEKTQEILSKYVDIVALWTVADCMPMLDENRIIVRKWLLQSQQSHHAFFQILSWVLGRPVKTEDDIGFFIGPMLNAAGRITTPYQSLRALLSGIDSAQIRIQELIEVNERRKALSRSSYERAIQEVDITEACILYVDETLEHGILGLLAAKLCELSHRPVGVFTLDKNNYVGSFRAPPWIDLVRLLDSVSPYMIRYGGHAGAAGGTVSREIFPAMKEAMLLNTETIYDMHEFSPVLSVDSVLDVQKITSDLVEAIESLRPFWIGFESPIFMIRDIVNSLSSLGKTGQHYKWNISWLSFEIIWFNLDDIFDELSRLPTVHLIWKISSRIWRDRYTIQFQVIDIVKV